MEHKAPKGHFLKGYYLSPWGYIRHCIVDDSGFVFAAGEGGWRRPPRFGLRLFPTPIPAYGPEGWDWAEWYEKNWESPSWAWVYGRCNQYFAGRRR